ncbi:NAD kinase [Schaalia suimastitidis]|uniref:NAD kinase n=1 Tax=Schaalia suimastitidis TaxID=121163 RepID=UPI000479327B|nr:NAD kinase [Schaalia suimastitidis]
MKRIMLVRHTRRHSAQLAASKAQKDLQQRGYTVVDTTSTEPVDLVLAMGGDGTILSAATKARQFDVPLLGLNMGHLGFLAEDSTAAPADLIDHIASGCYRVDTRMTLAVTLQRPDGAIVHDWALNEAVLMHTDVAHPIQLNLAVDGQDVSTYGADGMILATPTGSTAYSFSAGGPVVWPDTEAIVMAPLAAHGLFTRPMVVGPSSKLGVTVLDAGRSDAQVWCDGLRMMTVPTGSTVVATVSERPVRLVRLDDTPFSTRLVHKFHLPLQGWKGAHQGDEQ